MSRVWGVLELLRWTTDYLTTKGFTDARLNAELLLAGTLDVKRLDLYLQFDRPLQPHELAEFKARLLRRARHEPLQYIAGTADFRHLRLKVDPRVLIPRPETEILVGEVLAWAADKERLLGVDIGTGSGAIALSLATEGPFERIVATDISGDALDLARENLDSAAPGARVELREGAALDPLRAERFDVIASNPPYVASGERETLEPQVREWEPAAALFSGESGLDLIREIVRVAPAHLRDGGLLALEIGEGQAGEVLSCIRETGSYARATVRPDLTGRERIVLAERVGVWTAAGIPAASSTES